MKIFAATGVAIFSLVAVFTATIAWFAMNKRVDSTAMKINASNDFEKKFNKMTLHKYVKETNGNYQFDQNPSAMYTYNWKTKETEYKYYGEDQSVSAYMGEFSLINPRHPYLALIELSQAYTTNADEGKIAVDFHTDYGFICGLKDGGGFNWDLNNTGNPLSSIIKFSSSSYKSLTNNSGSATVDGTSYTTYDFAVPGTSSWQHFVEIEVDENGNLFYDNEDGWENDKNVITCSNGETVQYIAIIFDYYDDAIGYIYNLYLGNEVLEQASVPFVCDWTLVI